VRGAKREAGCGEGDQGRREARLPFAGQDIDAVQRARSYFTGYAPSSPQIALLKDGKLVYMIERHQIEGRSSDDIAADLTRAFEKYCEARTAA